MDLFAEAQNLTEAQEARRMDTEVLRRVDERKHTSADVLYLAERLSLTKDFTRGRD